MQRGGASGGPGVHHIRQIACGGVCFGLLVEGIIEFILNFEFDVGMSRLESIPNNGCLFHGIRAGHVAVVEHAKGDCFFRDAAGDANGKRHDHREDKG